MSDEPMKLTEEQEQLRISAYALPLEEVKRLINNARIVALPREERSVVHGHWVTKEEAEKMGDVTKAYTCSVCGHCDWDCTESEDFNFCPNCGADMRPEGGADG